MVKVMFISTGLNFGGAETQLVQLAIELKKRKYEVYVVSMLKPIAYVDDLYRLGIECTSLNMIRGIPDPRAIIGLTKIMKQWQPHIVHSHMVHANLLARIARLLHKVPVMICTAHSINEGRRWREIAYRLTDPLANLTTNVSHAAVDRYIQVGAVPKEKIKYMPNGVDTDRFKPNRVLGLRLREELGIKKNFVWLAVGRFEEAKDYPNMLRAFSEVVKERLDAVLLLIGQGTLFKDTMKLSCDLGLSDTVRFLGIRLDVPEFMNVADAYIMSSAWEGLPMVLLEAGASGLPIVATDVGGNSEIVLDGESGYIVPSHDALALAAAMRRMMSMSQMKIASMGQIGRVHIETIYSLNRIVDQWESIYDNFLRESIWIRNGV